MNPPPLQVIAAAMELLALHAARQTLAEVGGRFSFPEYGIGSQQDFDPMLDEATLAIHQAEERMLAVMGGTPLIQVGPYTFANPAAAMHYGLRPFATARVDIYKAH